MSEQDHLYEILSLNIQSVAPYFGLKPPVSEDMAAAIVSNLRKHMNGTFAYFSAATHDERRARDQQIRQEFDGKNFDQICRKYDVSKRTVYRALSSAPRTADAE